MNNTISNLNNIRKQTYVIIRGDGSNEKIIIPENIKPLQIKTKEAIFSLFEKSNIPTCKSLLDILQSKNYSDVSYQPKITTLRTKQPDSCIFFDSFFSGPTKFFITGIRPNEPNKTSRSVFALAIPIFKKGENGTPDKKITYFLEFFTIKFENESLHRLLRYSQKKNNSELDADFANSASNILKNYGSHFMQLTGSLDKELNSKHRSLFIERQEAFFSGGRLPLIEWKINENEPKYIEPGKYYIQMDPDWNLNSSKSEKEGNISSDEGSDFEEVQEEEEEEFYDLSENDPSGFESKEF